MTLRSLSNEALLESTTRAVANETNAIALVVEHLAEVERRKLFLDVACSHLTAYCIERLGYSSDAASTRVTAAYLALKYPLALELLQTRALNLTALRTLSPVLTPENHAERLRAAVSKSKSEIEELVASYRPERARWVAPLPKAVGPDMFKVELYVDRGERDLLIHARDLMRHGIPDGDLRKIVMHAVEDAVRKAEARVFGNTDKPRANDALTIIDARTPNRAQRRLISARDGYGCCYIGIDGTRCSAKAWIQYDHRDGYAITSTTDAASMRLLCKAHNLGRQTGHDDVTRAAA